jgi:hypothetical protein
MGLSHLLGLVILAALTLGAGLEAHRIRREGELYARRCHLAEDQSAPFLGADERN